MTCKVNFVPTVKKLRRGFIALKPRPYTPTVLRVARQKSLTSWGCYIIMFTDRKPTDARSQIAARGPHAHVGSFLLDAQTNVGYAFPIAGYR